MKNLKLTLNDPLNILKKAHKSFNLKNSSELQKTIGFWAKYALDGRPYEH